MPPAPRPRPPRHRCPRSEDEASRSDPGFPYLPTLTPNAALYTTRFSAITKPKLLTFPGRSNGRVRGAGFINETALWQREQIGMEGNTQVPVVEELAVLVERAERACRTTAQLVRDFNFIVVWHQSRPR